MGILRLPGLVQTVQPQSGLAQIDRGNSLTRALSDIWLGSSLGRTAIKGVPGTRSGVSSSATTVIEGVGPGGRFIRGDGTTTNAGWQINGNSNNLLDNSNTTWFVLRRCRDTTVRSSYMHYGYDSGGGNRAFVGAPDSTNITWDYGNATTGSGRLQTPYTKDTQLETLVLVAGQTKGREIWRRGVKLASNTSAKAVRSADSAAFGIGPMNNSTPFDDTETYLFGVSNREWSDAEIVSWCANPWQLFQSPQRAMMVSAGGDAPLASNSTAQATATGALTATAQLAGVSSAAASATGTLSLSASLSGASAAQASAAGTLAATGALAGAASAQAGSTAALKASVQLQGAATVTASAPATISASIALQGSASAAATASGTLSSQSAGLASNATCGATATGTLSATAVLAGSAASVATSSGAMSAAAAISGTATASTTASATIAAGAAIAGSAAASATATGNIKATASLAGSATATASATATLSAPGSGLYGNATASTNATGTLTATASMSGSASATASAFGTLGAGVSAISGSASAQSSASGTLTLGIALVSAAGVAAVASGALTAAAKLQGAAISAASGSGILTDLAALAPNPHQTYIGQTRIRLYTGQKRARSL